VNSENSNPIRKRDKNLLDKKEGVLLKKSQKHSGLFIFFKNILKVKTRTLTLCFRNLCRFFLMFFGGRSSVKGAIN